MAVQFHINERNHRMFIKQIMTDEELYDTIKRCPNILIEEQMEHRNDSSTPYWQGNLHSITDKIIENAGRFALKHASDILITFDSLKSEFNNKNIEQKYFTFAIRENGVDGNELFIARSQSETDRLRYRKIFFIQIIESSHEIDGSPILKIQLKES